MSVGAILLNSTTEALSQYLVGRGRKKQKEREERRVKGRREGGKGETV